MATKTSITNSVPFEFPKDALFYRVVQGNAYLFAVEKLQDGLDSARTEIASYKEGDYILCLPPGNKVRFVLTGTLGAQIEKTGMTAFKGKDGDAALQKALQNASALLLRGLGYKESFDAILKAKSREKTVREYAQNLSKELLAIRVADLMDESRAAAQKTRANDEAFSQALEDIAGVVYEKKSERKIESDQSATVKTARLVAGYSNMAIQGVQDKTYDGEDGLVELAKDNNVRMRAVTLKGAWWKNDNGALFGYYAADLQNENPPLEPAALIPEKWGGYLCVLPQSEKSVKVTQEVAEHLQRGAFMFYKPFADKSVSVKELLKFAFSSSKMPQDILLFVALGLASALVGLLIPLLTKVFVDSIIPQAAKNMCLQITSLAFLCVLSAMAFDFIKALAMTRMEARSDSVLQAAVMDRLLKLPTGFFRDLSSGDLAQKVLSISQIHEIIFSTIITSGMTAVFSLVYLIQLFSYSKYLLKWSLLFCLVSVLVTVFVAFFKYKWHKDIIDSTVKISGKLFEFITGVNKLVMTASEKRAYSIWAKLFSKQTKAEKNASAYNILYSTFVSVFPILTSLCFYGIFMNAVAKGKMDALSTGSFLAFIAAFTAFQNALIASTSAITESVQVIPMYEQAKVVLEAAPEIQESKPAISSLKGNIELNHISFRYEKSSPLILKDVSMKIQPHEFVAIVGGSGSGKSTLLRIMLGFEKPETGGVFYDNRDLNSVDVGSVRRNMGVVLQNSSIMQGSIYTNIIGSSALTIDDAWRAAEMAGLAADIERMPMGMHTMIPAGGGGLSGGQKQRLIIARALARRPSILIFDEATSALDNKTQAQVSKSLEALNVTRIVIAHRLSTIINADRIYVLNNGMIEECGTYEELMKKDGFFAKLAKRQQI